MLSSVIYSLSQICVDQIVRDGFTTRLSYGLGFIAFMAILMSLWLYMQLKGMRNQIAQTQSQLSAAQSEQGEFRSKSKELAKGLEERSKEVADLKSKLTKQKRKLHEVQESQKTQENMLREEYQKLEKSFAQKVAFSQPKVKPVEQKQPMPKLSEEVKVNTVKEEARPNFEEENQRLKRQISQLKDDLGDERKLVKTYKSDMRQIARRMEAFRRIDLLTKKKFELSEDKQAQLGRDYYDAISELAALKGEVIPPNLVKPNLPESNSSPGISRELSSEEKYPVAQGLVDFKDTMKEALQDEILNEEEKPSEELPGEDQIISTQPDKELEENVGLSD